MFGIGVWELVLIVILAAGAASLALFLIRR